jgi:gliding motility-associated-like protein
MEIFNRWGQLVFTTTDQHDYWDGTFDGMASPEGVYIYKVTYVPCGVIQDKKLITGHVSLLR